mgnify:CR=1 FL=1
MMLFSAGWELHNGDALEILRGISSGTVNTCVTSPPYYGLRDYGVAGQIGLESTPDEYICRMVEVFREVRRALRDDGTCWINLGDSYASDPGKRYSGTDPLNPDKGKSRTRTSFLPPKNLIGIPWRVALALQADGWYLRSDIIWNKPNAIPESVTDRPTKSHEYIFLLSKSVRYYYDAEAIKEPLADSSVLRLAQDIDNQTGSQRVPGKTNGNMKAVGPRFGGSKYGYDHSEQTRTKSGKETLQCREKEGNWGPYKEYCLANNVWVGSATRNKRDVWTIATKPYSSAHSATFPPEIPSLCIKAGCPEGGIVLDPFAGSGTTLWVAEQLGRQSIGIELNPEYCNIIYERMNSASAAGE